jgi:hypothetical protein
MRTPKSSIRLAAPLLCLVLAVGCESEADPVCGNGVTEAGEQCDLGSENDDRGACTSFCALPVCGDGFVQSGEECDDDSGSCEGCRSVVCGDTVVGGSETCDDGNDDVNDGCASCQRSGAEIVAYPLGRACSDIVGTLADEIALWCGGLFAFSEADGHVRGLFPLDRLGPLGRFQANQVLALPSGGFLLLLTELTDTGAHEQVAKLSADGTSLDWMVEIARDGVAQVAIWSAADLDDGTVLVSGQGVSGTGFDNPGLLQVLSLADGSTEAQRLGRRGGGSRRRRYAGSPRWALDPHRPTR